MDVLELINDWFWFAAGLWALTWTVLAYGLGVRQDRTGMGIVLGLLLGPLGVAITFALGEVDRRDAARREAQRLEDERFAATVARSKV